ncbi:MAG: methionine--tRNA ligase [Lachnospiraceae bacterium]|nr:methionine--tRNA ligase [Lachnospiraceae bacterium]
MNGFGEKSVWEEKERENEKRKGNGSGRGNEKISAASEKRKFIEKDRPVFPKRAVVTAGMPYGNKELHFGHIGGVFVHADTYARFLRDRIGKENVIFVSGTDCYGSPILESYRKLKESGAFDGTIEEYVRKNHLAQKKALDDYEISLNLYGASGFGRTKEVHQEVSNYVFETLLKHHYLVKMSTPQFFDEEKQVFLNGRQVVGKCPIEGCQSDKAYADECSMGHQYMPSELIDPISTLSKKPPVVKNVTNWYVRLDECRDMLKERVEYLRTKKDERKYTLNTIEEFLKSPVIYVQRKQISDRKRLEEMLPAHTVVDEEKKASITYVFENLTERDKAREVLNSLGIHFRTGKTLVPFRLSGNVEWGVKVPDVDDMKDLTFWVWPESLWAPISFTKAYLEQIGKNPDEYVRWWNDPEAQVYQFIGEDNIYFYGIAEMAIFAGLLSDKENPVNMKECNLPQIIANNHILFLDKKASSSSDIKPPMAEDLLSYYTPEQLRIHFLSLGLANKSVSFMPKVYLPKEKQTGVDTVLKDGNLLTNVFNRLVRSCFYTIQKYCKGMLPEGEPDEEIMLKAEEAAFTYERHMYRHEFHSITYVLDDYIRYLNKYYTNSIREAEKNDDQEARERILVNCFYGIRIALVLLHPIAPAGCEKVREYLGAEETIYCWDTIFEPIKRFLINPEVPRKELLPRVDFFEHHPSQFEEK